ncbi:Unknown protein [Striga hermonthica]|uniref:Pectinesterase inhibitor domain-containing protein n=1 Tax=Striga hermonthica TaxID=68872 RepID=A0A9N7NNA1_STRHE|nr:Unknown protein [Striga hermonthica]
MAFSPLQTILIALILSVSISPSLARKHKHKHKHHHRERDEPEYIPDDLNRELKDLCSQTDDSKVCWHIIEPEISRFKDTDPDCITDVLLDLAISRANEIHDELNGYHEDSKNDELKEKYLSCSKNYNDAVRNLNLAKTNLGSGDYENIPIQIEDTQQELEGCRGEFCEGSFDPGHIGNRVNEFDLYVNIVKVSVDRLRDWDSREDID